MSAARTQQRALEALSRAYQERRDQAPRAFTVTVQAPVSGVPAAQPEVVVDGETVGG